MADEALPSIDFATFIISMNHSALIQLGLAPHPDTNAIEANLSMARETIDLLALLDEKTKGNLTGDEEHLLHQVLFDLRMRCVEQEKALKAHSTGKTEK